MNDAADVLSPDQERTLVELSEALERETSAELAIATVRSLEGVGVEEYATRLFAEWGVGQQGRDNGVLILVAPADREMRIEVGYGLEPILSDGLAGEIIRTTFIPRFRSDDYAGGIVDGANRVAEIVRRNEVLTQEQRIAYARSMDDEAPGWVIVPFLCMFVGIGSLIVGVGVGARTVFLIIFGGLFAFIGLGLSYGLAPPAGAFVLAAVGIAALTGGIRLGRRPGVAANVRGKKKAKPGWVWGNSGSPSSRSGGGSGGSSSRSSSGFGGGRSGGGGASGRW